MAALPAALRDEFAEVADITVVEALVHGREGSLESLTRFLESLPAEPRDELVKALEIISLEDAVYGEDEPSS